MTGAPADFALSGRTALITGAGRGIGASLALGIAAAGADLVLVGRDRDALEDVAEAARRAGRRAETAAMDVSDSGSVAEAFDEIARRPAAPTLLVNNAGVEETRPSLDVDAALWERILDTNLKGAFFVAQAFAAPLIRSGRPGAVVNLCSLTSGVGVPTAAPYTASKSGLLGLTRALAAEWAPHGVRVNAIGPGYFRTELTEDFFRDDTWRAAMLAKIPQRRFGELDDLTGPTVFLLSPAAIYVTGQLLYVDGGFIAGV